MKNAWSKAAVDLVFPRNCQVCAMALAERERGVICTACLGQVKFIEPPFCRQCASPFAGEITDTFTCGYCQDLHFNFSRTVTAARAEGVARTAIHKLKYERALYFGTHLAEWLVAAAQRWIDWREVDGIVPVPLHPRKKREREFNQAELLTDALGEAVNKPVIVGGVRRVKDTSTQTRLGREARAKNLRGAFVVKDGGAFAGKRLVLVDDVFTTGMTLDSCAKVLRAAGAVNVMALTVARGM